MQRYHVEVEIQATLALQNAMERNTCANDGSISVASCRTERWTRKHGRGAGFGHGGVGQEA